MNKYFLLLFALYLQCIIVAQPPVGYYDSASGKQGDALKKTLQVIVTTNVTFLNYGSGNGNTWSGFTSTDRLANNQVWDIYSTTPRFFNGNYSVSGMNIEHSVPKSWWGGDYGNGAYNDLNHLRPSDATANTAKSNYPPGNVQSGVRFDNGIFKVGQYGNYTAFEVADEYKGDIARTYFYMFTAYQDLSWTGSSAPFSGNKPMQWLVDLLLQWDQKDPVDARERARNEAVYKIQHNRNPYIDNPSYVDRVWGNVDDSAFELEENQLRTWVQDGKLYVGAVPSKSYLYIYTPAGQLVQREVIEADVQGIYDLKEKGVLLIWVYSTKLNMWGKVINR